jgi:hypothetical protein
MSILTELEKFLPEMKDEKVDVKKSKKKRLKENEDVFEMEPQDDNYIITKGGRDVCTVQFVNSMTDASEDMEIAQEHPEKYSVYIMDVKDPRLTKEYEVKLSNLGFKEISKVGEAA